MHWNSVGDFFAMGGYALYVWGSFGACVLLMVVEPLLAKRRLNEVRQSLPASASPTNSTTNPELHETQTETHRPDCGRTGFAGARRRAGAERAGQQYRPLRHALRGRRRQGAAGQGLPYRRTGQGRLDQTPGHDRATLSSPIPPRKFPSPTPASFPTCSRKARAPWSKAGWAATASSPPPKCWPSTTKTTCRRKPSTPSTRPRRHKRSDARTRALRAHPRFFCRHRTGRDAPARWRQPRQTCSGWRWRRPAAQTQFLLIAVSFACLAQSFLANDFSVAYVANHSNTRLPTLYRFSAVWGGHEGSLLLWVLMLAGWGAAVSLASRQLPEVMVARVLAVLGLVGIGLLAFILFTSNPFERMLPAAAEGTRPQPVAAGSRAWCSIRRCSTWATSAFRWPSPSPSPR
jgi:heme exporter protein CcmD